MGMHGWIQRWMGVAAVAPIWSLGLMASEVQPLAFNTQAFAPFTYLREGGVSGPAVEVIRAVCREMGQTCRINLMPWARAQIDVRTGHADALFLIGWNPERATWLMPSLPLFASEYGFFVQTSDPIVFRDMRQLSGYTVAVYGPSNTSMTLEQIQHQAPGLSVDRTPDDDAAFRKLEAARVGAVFSNKEVGLAHIQEMGLRNVRYAGMQSRVTYHVGFSKARVTKAQVERFNEAYRKLLRSGELRRILAPYRLEPAPLDGSSAQHLRPSPPPARGFAPWTSPGRGPGPPSGPG